MAKILPIRRKTHSRKKNLPIEDRLSDISFYIYGKVTLNAEHHSLKRVLGVLHVLYMSTFEFIVSNDLICLFRPMILRKTISRKKAEN